MIEYVLLFLVVSVGVFPGKTERTKTWIDEPITSESLILFLHLLDYKFLLNRNWGRKSLWTPRLRKLECSLRRLKANLEESCWECLVVRNREKEVRKRRHILWHILWHILRHILRHIWNNTDVGKDIMLSLLWLFSCHALVTTTAVGKKSSCC